MKIFKFIYITSGSSTLVKLLITDPEIKGLIQAEKGREKGF
jgi:hypothetical protein